MPRRPSIQDLSPHLAGAARSIADVIARGEAHGEKRAWIVGGTPRDLALARSPTEVDMASAATPEEIERLFEGTIPVGRAFGTVIIRAQGADIQHTTFRSEGTYSDARRPDSVAFGKTVEEDSSRRDFTCNAVYLDPLDDRVLDPQGGLTDIAVRRLRCVGVAETRFREDGLRLLRMARFAAALDLEPDPETLAGARRSKDALRGVSAERILEELSKIFARPGALRALSLLADLDLLVRAIPGLAERVRTEGGHAAWWAVRRRIFESLPASPGVALGLAALLLPVEGGSVDWLALVHALRPSRALQRRVEEIAENARDAPAALAGSRSARLRWMRAPTFSDAASLARALALSTGADASRIEAAIGERECLGDQGLRPPPLVASEDLARAGILSGPRWGELLREAEDLQLDGRLVSREDALAWLGDRAREIGHEGGKTPRSA